MTQPSQGRKHDFPLLQSQPGIIYLDSAASAQKPHMVIDGISEFLRTSYANIHRGMYSLSETSEDLYEASKKAYAQLIGARADEIIYTYNATYGYNLISQTLRYSGILQAGDTILIDIAEHHANIVPRQILSQQHGLIIERIDVTQDFQYDIKDFQKKYHDRVKVVSLSAASNVTGVVYDLDPIIQLLREDTFFIVDGSQLIPHAPIQACTQDKGERIDALIATGHKLMTDTGLGMIRLRKTRINRLQPAWGGGGMIQDVQRTGFLHSSGREKFEPGTPHIIGALSLLKACEYIQSIGGYDAIMQHEKFLTHYISEKFSHHPSLHILGPEGDYTSGPFPKKLGIFSFTSDRTPNHIRIGEILAQENICIRSGGHCTHPLFRTMEIHGSCRISSYIYTSPGDIDRCFDVMTKHNLI